MGEYSSVWREICRVLSQIQWIFLGGILGKKYSRRIFHKFCAKPRLSILYRNLWNSGLISVTSLWVRIALKINSHKHFRKLFAPRQGGTSIKNHQRKIRGRKARNFCFRRTGFVHSRCRTYYALLLGYFGLKFLPGISHCFYWVFAEVWAPDSSHKIGNKFFIRHCQGWKEGSLVCETVWFFSCVNSHPFDLKFFLFCFKFSGDSWVLFQEKTIPGEFFRNVVQNQGYPLPKLVKFRRNFCNFILGAYCAEKNSHKHFRMLFAPGQGGTSINESQKEDTGKKSRDVLFSENRFCSLSVWDLLRLTCLLYTSPSPRD